MRTIYQILELPLDASETKIKQAWRNKVWELHPDRGGSADAMIELNDAYRDRHNVAKQDPYIWTKPGEAKFHNMFADRRI